MGTHPLRSDCPIAASLDVLGDRWTLLVLRDLLLRDSRRFGEFAREESIATNVLSDRLARLVALGLIERSPDPEDGRRVIYRPLAPAIELLPMIVEFAAWGLRHTAVGAPPPEMAGFTDRTERRRAVERRTRALVRELEASS